MPKKQRKQIRTREVYQKAFQLCRMNIRMTSCPRGFQDAAFAAFESYSRRKLETFTGWTSGAREFDWLNHPKHIIPF